MENRCPVKCRIWSSSTTADTAAREDRRGHGQRSPDPLQSDPKRSSQPLECFGSPSPKSQSEECVKSHGASVTGGQEDLFPQFDPASEFPRTRFQAFPD